MNTLKGFVLASVLILAAWQGISYPPAGPQSGANFSVATSGSTVGVGGFWGGLGTPIAQGGTGTFSAGGTGDITANNTTRVLQFYLDSVQVVGHGTIGITTLVSGSTVDVGIYSAGGPGQPASGTKLLNLGGVSGASTGNVSASFTQVTIPPGYYYEAWCGNAASGITGLGYREQLVTAQVSGTTTSLININGVRYGTAANSCTSGVLPSTLSTLTAVNSVASHPPQIWWEP